MPDPNHPDQPAGDEPRDERDPSEQPTDGGDAPTPEPPAGEAADAPPFGGDAPAAEPSGAGEQPTGPTEPLSQGDPLGGEPERPAPGAGRAEWPAPGAEADAGGDEPGPSGAPGGAPPPGGVPPTAQGPPGDGGGAGWSGGAGGPGAPRRLTRSASDRMLGGVSGGLGRYFGIDPIIFRIAFVVLTFAGGAGIFAYVAMLLFVPSDDPDADRSTGQRALRIVGGAVLVIAALSFLGPGLFWAGPGLLPLAVLVVIVVLLVRAARGGQGDDFTRVLARIGLVLVVIALAGAGAVAVALGAAVGGGTLIAIGVIVAGLALAAAGFFGGARWMILPALVLAVPLGVVAAADLSLDGGTGEREYRPTTVAALKPDYRLGAGEMRLDLTKLRLPEGDTPLRVSMGAGHVEVIVPRDVCVASNVDVRMGYAEVPGRADGGFDVDYRELPASLGGNPRLVIDADMAMGAVEVLRPGEPSLDSRDGEDWDRWDRVDRVTADENAACERTT
jgi:phage shock protein PspC (stress-responsive transcriptional regulator)